MAQTTKRDDKSYLAEYRDKLSDTARRAKWISGSDEHADHDGQTLATRSHDVIRAWAEERGAKPATIGGTEHEGRPGVLRFDFPGYGEGGRLEHIEWERWFESFDERELVFMFQERLKSGEQSNFFKLDNPHREEG